MAKQKKIDEILISNFKFFPEWKDSSQSIKIGGKHLLLYGENGSGKSSIFWGLYTLLECANKIDRTEISKYFKPSDPHNLLNIYVEPNHGEDKINNAYVYLKFLNDHNDKYKISIDDLDINENEEAQESNFASDFINYRFIYNVSNFRHKNKIDLFEHFTYSLFPYVKMGPCEIWQYNNSKKSWSDISETNANKIIDFMIEGPDYKLDDGDVRIYDTTETKINTIKDRVTKILKELDNLMGQINSIGNDILHDELGYPEITFKLEVEETESFALNEKKYTPPKVNIWLSIPEYDGKKDKVHRMHSFLNEAKLTAVSLAVRFAILERRPSDAEVKILVLDDMMISLDMNNREKVLNLIFTKYLNLYQILFFIHDKVFFNYAKLFIKKKSSSDAWQLSEMYEDEINKKPVILNSDTYYAKGIHHLKTFDYPACGNYFRKYSEEIFEEEFPREVTISSNGQKKRDLKNYIEGAVAFYKRLNLNTDNLVNLENYLYLLLNPLSHRAIDLNVYKTELFFIRELLPKIDKEVKSYRFKELIPAVNNMVITFIESPTIIQEYYIKTKEPIYLFTKNGSQYLSDSVCKSIESLTITNGVPGAKVKNKHYKENNLLLLHKRIYAHKGVQYDNSIMTNIYHIDFQTQQRISLQQL